MRREARHVRGTDEIRSYVVGELSASNPLETALGISRSDVRLTLKAINEELAKRESSAARETSWVSISPEATDWLD